jgi:hypothetical protein
MLIWLTSTRRISAKCKTTANVNHLRGTGGRCKKLSWCPIGIRGVRRTAHTGQPMHDGKHGRLWDVAAETTRNAQRSRSGASGERSQTRLQIQGLDSTLPSTARVTDSASTLNSPRLEDADDAAELMQHLLEPELVRLYKQKAVGVGVGVGGGTVAQERSQQCDEGSVWGKRGGRAQCHSPPCSQVEVTEWALGSTTQDHALSHTPARPAVPTW